MISNPATLLHQCLKTLFTGPSDTYPGRSGRLVSFLSSKSLNRRNVGTTRRLSVTGQTPGHDSSRTSTHRPFPFYRDRLSSTSLRE